MTPRKDDVIETAMRWINAAFGIVEGVVRIGVPSKSFGKDSLIGKLTTNHERVLCRMTSATYDVKNRFGLTPTTSH